MYGAESHFILYIHKRRPSRFAFGSLRYKANSGGTDQPDKDGGETEYSVSPRGTDMVRQHTAAQLII